MKENNSGIFISLQNFQEFNRKQYEELNSVLDHLKKDIELIHLKDNLNNYLMTLPEFDKSKVLEFKQTKEEAEGLQPKQSP